jgi:hypothetical protein
MSAAIRADKVAGLHFFHIESAARALNVSFLSGVHCISLGVALFNRFIVQRLIKPKIGLNFTWLSSN